MSEPSIPPWSALAPRRPGIKKYKPGDSVEETRAKDLDHAEKMDYFGSDSPSSRMYYENYMGMPDYTTSDAYAAPGGQIMEHWEKPKASTNLDAMQAYTDLEVNRRKGKVSDKAYNVLTNPSNPESPFYGKHRTYASGRQIRINPDGSTRESRGIYVPATGEVFVAMEGPGRSNPGTAEHEMNHAIDHDMYEALEPGNQLIQVGSDIMRGPIYDPVDDYPWLSDRAGDLNMTLRSDIITDVVSMLRTAGEYGDLPHLQHLDPKEDFKYGYVEGLSPEWQEAIGRWASMKFNHDWDRIGRDHARRYGEPPDGMDVNKYLSNQLMTPIAIATRVGSSDQAPELPYYNDPLSTEEKPSPYHTGYRPGNNTELFVRMVAPWYQEPSPRELNHTFPFASNMHEYLRNYMNEASDYLSDHRRNVGGLTKSDPLPVFPGYVFGGFAYLPRGD